MYEYSYAMTNRNFNVMCDGLACHGDELPFVFATINDYSFVHFTPTTEQSDFSFRINTAWSNFIKTGNPNSEDDDDSDSSFLPFTGDEVLLNLNENQFNRTTYSRANTCSFWINSGLYPQ